MEVYDLVSYWSGDSGPAFGIHIRYKDVKGKPNEDWLGFIGDKEEPHVQFNRQAQRPATEEDIQMFESFLLYTKNVVDQDLAEQEKVRQEQQAAEKLRVFKKHLGKVAYYSAKTALELEDISRVGLLLEESS